MSSYSSYGSYGGGSGGSSTTYSPPARISTNVPTYNYNSLAGANYSNFASGAYGKGSSLSNQASGNASSSLATALNNLGSARSSLGSGISKVNTGPNFDLAGRYSLGANSNLTNARNSLSNARLSSSTSGGSISGGQASGILGGMSSSRRANQLGNNLTQPRGGGGIDLSRERNALARASQSYNLGQNIRNAAQTGNYTPLLKGGGTTPEMISSGLAGVSSGTEQIGNQMLGLKPKTGRGQSLQFLGAGGGATRASNAINKNPFATGLSIIESATSGNVPALNAIDNIFGINSSGAVSKIANATPGVGALGRYSSSVGEKTAALPGVNTNNYTPSISPGATTAAAGGSDAAYRANEYALRYPTLSNNALQQAQLYEQQRNAYNKGRQNVLDSRKAFEGNKAVMQKMVETGRHPNGTPLTRPQLQQYYNNLQNQANEIKRREQAVKGSYNTAQGIYGNLQQSNDIRNMNQDARMSEQQRRNKLAQTGRAYMLADSMLPRADNLSKGERGLRSAAQLADAFIPATGGLATPIVDYGQSLTRLPQRLREAGQTDYTTGGERVPSLNPTGNVAENFLEMTGENLNRMPYGANPFTRGRQALHGVNEFVGGGNVGRALIEPVNMGAGALNYGIGKTITPAISAMTDSARNPKGTGEMRGAGNFFQRLRSNALNVIPFLGRGINKNILGNAMSGVGIDTRYEQAMQDARNKELYGQDYVDAKNNEANFRSSRTAPAQGGPLADPMAYRASRGAVVEGMPTRPTMSQTTGIIPGMMVDGSGKMRPLNFNVPRRTPFQDTTSRGVTPDLRLPAITPDYTNSLIGGLEYLGLAGSEGGIGTTGRAKIDPRIAAANQQERQRAEGLTPAQYNQLLEQERMIMHQATKRRLTDGEKTALRVARQQRMQEEALRAGRLPAQRELTNRELETMRQQSEPGFLKSVTQGGLFDKQSREQFNRLDAQRPTGIQKFSGGSRPSSDEISRKGMFAPRPNVRTNDLPRQPMPNVRNDTAPRMIGLGSMRGRELPLPTGGGMVKNNYNPNMTLKQNMKYGNVPTTNATFTGQPGFGGSSVSRTGFGGRSGFGNQPTVGRRRGPRGW